MDDFRSVDGDSRWQVVRLQLLNLWCAWASEKSLEDWLLHFGLTLDQALRSKSPVQHVVTLCDRSPSGALCCEKRVNPGVEPGVWVCLWPLCQAIVWGHNLPDPTDPFLPGQVAVEERKRRTALIGSIGWRLDLLEKAYR